MTVQLNLLEPNVGNSTPSTLDPENHQNKIPKPQYKEFNNNTGEIIGNSGCANDIFNTVGLLQDGMHPVGYCDDICIESLKTVIALKLLQKV